MKVCLLSHSDGRGGGYAAAYRLYQGLQGSGVDSTMLVGDKNRDDITVLSPQSKLTKGWSKIAPSIDALPKSLYPKRDRTAYSLQWLPDGIAAKVAQIAPDIINLHWTNAGYLQIETLAKFKQPIIWTLHDMWPFTGGCHYSQECDRYTKSCGACPQLNSTREWDLSRWVWRRKAKAWNHLNLTIVTPSNWLAERARSSTLLEKLPIEVIPNGLDLKQYKPIERSLARQILDFPQDKQLILFGAIKSTSDRRKGFNLLLSALQKLVHSEWKDKIELIVFGASQPSEPPNFAFKTRYLGRLSDDISLCLLYSAADVFVAPSLQDNLPNTVMEALACGTPCVAFKIGGMPDMIEHQQNGYLAQPFAIEDFARGITWVLEDSERAYRLGDRARKKVEQAFGVERQAHRYRSLFEEVCSRSKCSFN
ncbi:glycosyltransferase [Candidatus Gracilibacteria bacterium]|nr:glycosyltransferase [Candidatus Gracilibacteria bacterium]NJM87064.1 glycosyltransferase [Hydrococcus sp. RU_2_2]NJP18383.1 glycosyltransferase [Hydrococcus sp. CRU_1_1]